MSTTDGSLPLPPEAAGPADDAVLLDAMENATSAIFCLSGPSAELAWANARARALGPWRSALPVLDGRSVPDLVEGVLRTGRPATLRGSAGEGGPAATVLVRPLRVAGGVGALLVFEADAEPVDAQLWPDAALDLVEQAQLSLLPPSLPMLPDVRLSGSYHRATSVRAAGGDWYDAVPLGKGRLALVVGDAVGHGIAAAGAMSRLRGALRTTVQRDPSPASVLAALDAFAAHMEDVEGASVLYGVLDAGTGELVYTAAGHPPPLVVQPDGATTLLPVTPRPPLGTLPGSSAPVHTAHLEQGATLVLYSDGAVAVPGGHPAEGTDRLAHVARATLAAADTMDGDDTAGLAGVIAEGVRTTDGWPDDVAVLVAHRRAVAAEPLQLDLAAVPSALPGVRRRLGSWLVSLGMGEQDRVGVMVAVGEACANAAEHAYRGAEAGPMSVSASVDVDGLLTVVVRDRGTWRPPARDPGDRGRGLLIMRQLLDGVSIEEERGTTVTMRIRLRRTPEPGTQQGAVQPAATVVVDREVHPPVVRVTGSVDDLGAEQMRIRLLEASHGGTGRVALDLGQVGLFSSAAVRVVLAVSRIARDEGWRLVVFAPEGGVTRHILQISGLGELIDLR